MADIVDNHSPNLYGRYVKISSFTHHPTYTKMMSVGFEPTPTKTTALTLRLRPLSHDVMIYVKYMQNIIQYNTTPATNVTTH